MDLATLNLKIPMRLKQNQTLKKNPRGKKYLLFILQRRAPIQKSIKNFKA